VLQSEKDCNTFLLALSALPAVSASLHENYLFDEFIGHVRVYGALATSMDHCSCEELKELVRRRMVLPCSFLGPRLLHFLDDTHCRRLYRLAFFEQRRQ